MDKWYLYLFYNFPYIVMFLHNQKPVVLDCRENYKKLSC